jgi:dipeptidyl aminopeptidase/acylaminoacyl peptidase
MRHVVVTSVLILALRAGVEAQEKRPVAFEDILAMKMVSEPAVSPDGLAVLFTVTAWEAQDGEEEPAKMESLSHVYRVTVASAETTQLTFGAKGESAPAWSPDGSWISFLSARGGEKAKNDADAEAPKRQIWLLRAAGGEAFRLTSAPEGVTSYAWSPDGSRIAFTAKEQRSDEDERKRKAKDDPLLYEGDARMLQLWTMEAGEVGGSGTRPARQHTRGSDLTIRGRPSWSPDGSRIAFTGAPTLWLRDQRDDVYVLSLESDRLEKITANPGPDESPVFSPDGSAIAFLTTPNESAPLPDGTQTSDLRNARLALYDLRTKTTRKLADPGFDLIPEDPMWAPDGSRLLFRAGDRSYLEVYAYEIGERRYRKLTRNAIVALGNLSRDGSVAAFTMESSDTPWEVYLSGTDFASPRKLTTMNPQVSSFEIGASEVITWRSSEGYEVEGVLLKPVGFRRGTTYPLLVVPHGGPTGAHVNHFRMRYGDGGQHWAGQGWAVLYPNPRGSTNYGEAFMRGNLADWGGGDYRDIIAGVDAVVALGIADPERLAIQGWSYGGYMTCWTVSQTTRFRAAMIGAGLTNLVSMYGTNDVPNYLGAFFNGTLSSETEHLYRERSGLTFSDQVRTPTLILHGGSDERVPIGQPMEFYRALKDRGVPVELVFYPREGHGLQEYYHRLDRMKRQYEWISRHTLGGATSTTN